MEFTIDLTLSETATYKRWTSDCGMYMIAWYFWNNKDRKIKQDPAYSCYRSSMAFPGSKRLKTFKEAVSICEKDSKVALK